MSFSLLQKNGPLKAAQDAVTLELSGAGTVAIQLTGGTFTGTVTFEASITKDTWTALRMTPPNSSTAVTTATAAGLWSGSCAGMIAVRARCSAFTSGSLTADITAVPVGGGGSGGGGGGAGTDVNIAEVGGVGVSLGQAAMAASFPVVIASDQTAIPVTGSFSAASVGVTGDPVPLSADFIGFQEPGGDLEGLKAESFDYDTGGGTQAQTAIGIAIPASGGPVPVGAANPLPVSAASLPLPTGAATLAEQQTQTTALGTLLTTTGFNAAFGTAGTADAQVLSVQGIASMTPVQVSQATAANLNATVVGTGTFAAQVTAVGTIADDATTPGSPVMIGGTAKNPDGTDPGSVSAEDDVTRLITDRNRRLYVNGVHPRTLRKHLDGSSAYTDESVVADPGDGFQTVITNIIASTGAATALNFFLEEGASKIFGPIYLEAVAGRGFASGPMYLPVTASTAVTLTSSANIAQSFDIEYFIQAVP